MALVFWCRRSAVIFCFAQFCLWGVRRSATTWTDLGTSVLFLECLDLPIPRFLDGEREAKPLSSRKKGYSGDGKIRRNGASSLQEELHVKGDGQNFFVNGYHSPCLIDSDVGKDPVRRQGWHVDAGVIPNIVPEGSLSCFYYNIPRSPTRIVSAPTVRCP